MLVPSRTALRALLLLPALLQNACAAPAPGTSSPTITSSLLGRTKTEIGESSGTAPPPESCPVITEEDQQHVVEVRQELQRFTNKQKLKAFWDGIDKFQLAAALTSILGEATLGKVVLHDEAAITDGLLAVPTVLVSLVGGFQAMQKLKSKDARLDEWKSIKGLDSEMMVTQVSIWVVCLVLMFEGVLSAGFNGIEKPEHYALALGTHSAFLGLNILQGIVEAAKGGSLSAGTGHMKDTIKLLGWKTKDLATRAGRWIKGLINFSGRVIEHQQSIPQPKVETFVPMTREIARMAIEAGYVEECIKDSKDFHDRTSELSGKPASDCRTEWRDRFRGNYQNSGDRHEDEDNVVGDHADMIRHKTLESITGGEDEGGDNMMKAIIVDAAGNIIPAIIFAFFLCLTNEKNPHAEAAGTSIFGATTAMQMMFLGKSTKALHNMFSRMGANNPKAVELTAKVNEAFEPRGELHEYKDVTISVMVLSSKAEDYERHQGRFFLRNFPKEKEQLLDLEKKLVKIAASVKVYRPQVFADTSTHFFGSMFNYENPDGTPYGDNHRNQNGHSGENSHSSGTDAPGDEATMRRRKTHDSGHGAHTITWSTFERQYANVDFPMILEELQKVHDDCDKSGHSPHKTRAADQSIPPWSHGIEY